MAIPVKLEVFEGPLDLLLHLIEKNKVDIYDIPISLITEQYLEYVKNMPKEDLNVVSEFLVNIEISFRYGSFLIPISTHTTK